MNASSLPLGRFTCPVAFEIVRAPTFARTEEGGVTYLTGRNYELTYRALLRFANSAELAIAARLFGELNQQVVIRERPGADKPRSAVSSHRDL